MTWPQPIGFLSVQEISVNKTSQNSLMKEILQFWECIKSMGVIFV